MNIKTTYKDLGLIPYKQAWDYQEALFNKIVSQKLENEKLSSEQQKPTDNYLLFCEHPHVFTLGKSGNEHNMLVNMLQLQQKQAEFYHINRGGDITYHGPGQIVGYPILNLSLFVKGVREYIEKLEQSIINTIKHYDIKGERMAGATGVWIDTDKPGKTRKICAIGVRTSRWVSMHGFALNVNTDLSYFNMINPCGFTDKKVTSIKQEIGKDANMEEVKKLLRSEIAKEFEIDLSNL